MVDRLADIAREIKKVAKNDRTAVLRKMLQKLQLHFPFLLPHNPK